MRLLKQFEEYISLGIVKKVSPDMERAKSLVKESERKMISMKQKEEKLGITLLNANDYVEYCYDLLMHIVRAHMYLEGYSSSGQGAHEAEVSYLRILDFSDKDVQFADQMRYFRNGILYYGTVLDVVYAEKVIAFTKKVYPKLSSLIQKRIL